MSRRSEATSGDGRPLVILEERLPTMAREADCPNLLRELTPWLDLCAVRIGVQVSMCRCSNAVCQAVSDLGGYRRLGTRRVGACGASKVVKCGLSSDETRGFKVWMGKERQDTTRQRHACSDDV